jgi:hypothetical protein
MLAAAFEDAGAINLKMLWIISGVLLALGHAALFNTQPAVAYHRPSRTALSNVQPCGCSSRLPLASASSGFALRWLPLPPLFFSRLMFR